MNKPNSQASVTRINNKFVVEFHGRCINTYNSLQIALRHLKAFFEEPSGLLPTPEKVKELKEARTEADTLIDDKGLKEEDDIIQ